MKCLNTFYTVTFIFWSCFIINHRLLAQEMAIPLPQGTLQASSSYGTSPTDGAITYTLTTTLPFFDDFNNTSHFPNPDLWSDSNVYINNHFVTNMFSRGVATFDANGPYGIPYSIVADASISADHLTSNIIDLSGFNANDSLYLSFYYLCKGLGYAPKPNDSLIVYLKNAGGNWRKVWSKAPNTISEFQSAMIPITDSIYFHSTFQFRISNKATIGISNAHWHIDWVKFDKNRNYTDDLIDDISTTKSPTNLLNDFTAMPWNHFKTNPNAFLAITNTAYFKNNNFNASSGVVAMTSKELNDNVNLGTESINIDLLPTEEKAINFSVPNTALIPNISTEKIVENKYYLKSFDNNIVNTNDTIVFTQHFSNYFAYDDGSAEQAYFLNLAPLAPGKTAVEFALYTPDTIRGVAIKFVPQVPDASYKNFSLAVYKKLENGLDRDEIIYQQDYYFPNYGYSIEEIPIFTFDEPVAMDAGIFYIGIIQPAGGISDSLMIALDANRIGANHRYYNIGVEWIPSLLDGALLVRPMIGAELPAKIEEVVKNNKKDYLLYPNPANKMLNFNFYEDTIAWTNKKYTIYSLTGNIMQTGSLNNYQIDIQHLPAQIYLIEIEGYTVKKWIKY